jgi:hypothetical protein
MDKAELVPPVSCCLRDKVSQGHFHAKTSRRRQSAWIRRGWCRRFPLPQGQSEPRALPRQDEERDPASSVGRSWLLRFFEARKWPRSADDVAGPWLFWDRQRAPGHRALTDLAAPARQRPPDEQPRPRATHQHRFLIAA